MNVSSVIAALAAKYPGKTIVRIPQDQPTEILCEIDPTADHPDYSIAISVIDVTVPHMHKKVTETYEVLSGTLKVFVEHELHNLTEGDTRTIFPGQKHWAEGKETWVKVTSTPGWTPEDHIPY